LDLARDLQSIRNHISEVSSVAPAAVQPLKRLILPPFADRTSLALQVQPGTSNQNTRTAGNGNADIPEKIFTGCSPMEN
jgi:hypothetical protein